MRAYLMRIAFLGVFLFLAFIWAIPSSHATVYFYRGGVAGAALSDSFERTANWSTKPRGLADGAVPGAADVAVFNYSGTTVRLRSPTKIGGIVFASTWTGSFVYGTGSLTVGTSGIRIGSGTFLGGNASSLLHNSGSLVMTGGVVTNLAGTFNQSGSVSIMSVSNSRPQFTLTGTLVLRPNGTVNTFEIGKHRVTVVIQTLTMTASNSARMRVTGSGMSLSGALTVNSGTLDLTKTSTAQPLVVEGAMTVANDATARLLLGGNNVTLTGNLTVKPLATFSQTGGTTELNGTLQTLSGSVTFSTLKKIANDTLSFYPGYTYTMTTLNTHGSSLTSKLTMKSSINGQRWNISNGAAYTTTHVDLRDSNNSSSFIQTCLDCTDSGNNESWSFQTTPTATPSTTTTSSGGGGGGGRSTAASAALQGTTPVGPVAAPIVEKKKNTALEKRIAALQKALDRTKNAKAKDRLQRAIKMLSRRLK